MPVKRITRGGVGFRAYTVIELGRPAQPCQSLLERKALTVLRHNPFCRRLEAQPLTIALDIADHPEMRSYTPDFELITDNGRYLGETKPAEKLAEADVQSRIRAARDFCATSGYTGFLVLTELHVERQPRLSNAMLLKRFRGFPMESDLRNRILEDVENSLGVTVQKLVEEHGPGARSTAIALVAGGHLACDMNLSLYDASPLWLTSTYSSMEQCYADIFSQ